MLVYRKSHSGYLFRQDRLGIIFFYFECDDQHLSSFFLFFPFSRRWNFNHPLFSPTSPSQPPITLTPAPSQASLSSCYEAATWSLNNRNLSRNQSSPNLLRASSPVRHYLEVPARPAWLDCDVSGTSPTRSIRLLGFGDASYQDDFWLFFKCKSNDLALWALIWKAELAYSFLWKRQWIMNWRAKYDFPRLTMFLPQWTF